MTSWQTRTMWLTKLMGYDFTVEYQSGRENKAADALSRHNEQAVLLAISQPVPSWLALVRSECGTDPEL